MRPGLQLLEIVNEHLLAGMATVGELFGSTVSEDETTDLLLVITAQVLD